MIAMKKYLLILLLTLIFSSQAFTQSLRKCGCQTWKEWNLSTPNHEESRRERIKNYEVYKHQCIANCRKGNKGKRK